MFVGEAAITPRISLVAVCCSSASDRSRVRACTSSNSRTFSRTFSIAIAAWRAKVVNSAICLSVNGLTSARRNLVDIIGGATILVHDVWSIVHQASRFAVVPQTVHRRQSRAQRQGVDANAVGVHKRVGDDKKRIRAALERLEGGRDILPSVDFQPGDIEAERGGRYLNLAHRQ